MSDLPEKTSKLSLNPAASEWKPNIGANSFVPSGFAPKEQPVATTPSPFVPEVQPATRVVNLTTTTTPSGSNALSPDSPKPSTPKTAEVASPQAPEKVAAKEETPKPKPSTKPSTSSPKAKDKADSKTTKSDKAEKSETLQEELERIDDEVLTELYGKEHINVVFMGHVDAGKSTMGGNILFLTGMVDKRTMEKYERDAKEAGRESWYLSWALDTNTEERAKGKTVECGRAYFETDKRRYTILDAPGHKLYVPSMITGASQADIGVLVISARKGEFETGFERGGQTREHTMLAKTSGVSKLVIAINKMDDPTVEWDKERYDEILSKLTPFLKQSGYNPKNDITFMPLSGYTGANIKDRFDGCSWYKGPSLLEFLDNMQMVDRKIQAPFMFPVSEKYKNMGTIVVGKVESGSVKKGQSVVLMPNKLETEVVAIYNEGDEENERDHAICGDNVRIRLKGVEESDVSVGFMLCNVKHPVKTATEFEAQVAILEHKSIICAGYGAVLHIHTAVEDISVTALLHLIDKKTGRKTKRPPHFLKQGQQAIARFKVAEPICVEMFSEYAQLGRFTLRDEGNTVAIGRVTKVITEN